VPGTPDCSDPRRDIAIATAAGAAVNRRFLETAAAVAVDHQRDDRPGCTPTDGRTTDSCSSAPA